MDTILNLRPSENSAAPRELLRRTGRLLLQPARFFHFDFPAFDTPSLLAFGVGNAWIASVIAFFVQTVNSLLLSRLLDRWMRHLLDSEDGFSVWTLSGRSFLYTSAATLLGPFLFLLQATVGGFLLFLFARLLIEDRAGAPEPVTYTAALRIRAAALGSQWYTLVPVFGGLLAFVAQTVLLITGVRERFGVSSRRATAVVLAPYLLLFLALLFLGAIALVAMTQIPVQDFLDVDSGPLGF